MALPFKQRLEEAIENLDVPSIAIEAKRRDGN
jgi:hypothetical protein